MNETAPGTDHCTGDKPPLREGAVVRAGDASRHGQQGRDDRQFGSGPLE